MIHLKKKTKLKNYNLKKLYRVNTIPLPLRVFSQHSPPVILPPLTTTLSRPNHQFLNISLAANILGDISYLKEVQLNQDSS